MKKTVVINQYFGLGDIIFIEPIYRHFHRLGYDVIAPVLPEYLWIQDYIPYVQFKDKDTYEYSYETVEQPEDGRLHIPLRFAHPLYRKYDDLHYGDDKKNWMRDKYRFLKLDEWLWRTGRWQRNMERELKLFKEVFPSGIAGDACNIKFTKPYNLINENFGGSFEKINIYPDNGIDNIYLRKIEGFTLLDWGMLIEGATNIYTVETSLVWVIELLRTQAKQLHIFPKLPFLSNVDYFKEELTKDWIFHDENSLLIAK